MSFYLPECGLWGGNCLIPLDSPLIGVFESKVKSIFPTIFLPKQKGYRKKPVTLCFYGGPART